MCVPVSDLKTSSRDTLSMLISVTVPLMSPEVVLEGSAAQLSLYVLPFPNQKIPSSEHLENC